MLRLFALIESSNPRRRSDCHSFDLAVEDKMNVIQFCNFMHELRERRKAAVFAMRSPAQAARK